MTVRARLGAAMAALLAMSSLAATSSLAAPVQAQSTPPLDEAPMEPACELAFRLAAQAATPASSPAAGELDGLSPATAWSVDMTIRACASLASWAAGAALYPEVLAERDGLLLLLDRCGDPASGLALAPVCSAVMGGPPSPSASLSPSPSPTPTPSPSPSASLSPSPTPTPSPSPSASLSPSPTPTPSPSLSPTPTPSPSPSAEARFVRLPRFPTRVKGADRVRTFAIRGSTPEELLQAMQEGAARVCPQHASACTLTQPRIRPRVVTNPRTGSCRVTGLQVSADDTVHIPRWAGPRQVYPELVAWWREVNAHVRWHEAQHIRITQRHLASLRKRIVGKSCQRINAEVQRVSQKVMQENTAFDQRDQGWLPTYDGPRP